MSIITPSLFCFGQGILLQNSNGFAVGFAVGGILMLLGSIGIALGLVI
jgi:4-amino-4-deoxy-L-arabinose transferase-like glycosyltransferase